MASWAIRVSRSSSLGAYTALVRHPRHDRIVLISGEEAARAAADRLAKRHHDAMAALLRENPQDAGRYDAIVTYSVEEVT
jgi:hypothetical protein